MMNEIVIFWNVSVYCIRWQWILEKSDYIVFSSQSSYIFSITCCYFIHHWVIFHKTGPWTIHNIKQSSLLAIKMMLKYIWMYWKCMNASVSNTHTLTATSRLPLQTWNDWGWLFWDQTPSTDSYPTQSIMHKWSCEKHKAEQREAPVWRSPVLNNTVINWKTEILSLSWGANKVTRPQLSLLPLYVRFIFCEEKCGARPCKTHHDHSRAQYSGCCTNFLSGCWGFAHWVSVIVRVGLHHKVLA